MHEGFKQNISCHKLFSAWVNEEENLVVVKCCLTSKLSNLNKNSSSSHFILQWINYYYVLNWLYFKADKNSWLFIVQDLFETYNEPYKIIGCLKVKNNG